MLAVLATSNPGKVREIRAILDGSGLDVEHLPLFIAYEETGSGYLDNARRKAAAAVRLVHRPCLAEDAGIEVDALHGLPGPHSARFSGQGDDANNGKLLRLLGQSTNRRARYRAVAVLKLPDGREFVGEGTFEGSIAHFARGSGGFGYDPLFIPNGMDVTVGEMDDRAKNAISHRGRALRALVVQARAAGVLQH